MQRITVVFGEGVTVEELIEAVRHMPGDAEVLIRRAGSPDPPRPLHEVVVVEDGRIVLK